MKEVDELIIVIAAAQISHTIKNPLKAGERIECLRLMLENSDIKPNQYWLIPAQDVFDNSLWVYHLKRLLPKFDVFYGNNPYTTLLFEEAGIETKNTILHNRESLEAAKIREKIINEEDISDLVDPSVEKYLKEVRTRDRLLATYEETLHSKQRGSELNKNN